MPNWRSTFLAIGVLVGAAAACAQEEYPGALWAAQHATSASEAAPDGGAPLPPGSCRQAVAQPYPQRLAAMSSSAASGSNLVYVTDLFNSFVQSCGTCHGPGVDAPGQGSFRIATSTDFTTLMTPAVLAHVMSNQTMTAMGAPDEPMPPAPLGKPFDTRTPADPIYQWAELVQQWLGLHSPPSFTPGSSADAGGPISGDAGDAGTVSALTLSISAGNAMTNLGNCIPDADLVAHAAQSQAAVALDKKFASIVKQGPNDPGALPATLDQTDLVSFDESILAATGVVAFQPAYPLWSDDAGKIRMVRVPIGQSIHFDKPTQEFKIPDNTRFYKTFMRKIADTDGSLRWRKIETRLIVVRNDTLNTDGSYTVNSIFGTYLWNDNESQATLHVDPLNDGLPFSDKLLTVTIDEQLAADLLSQNPPDPDYTLVSSLAARHYAIPSSDRCVECHMGSPSHTFVLGFRPVQIKRRVSGEGGTLVEPGLAPATADELSQLQRLTDYGVLTGIDSTDDVNPLENSEGSRTPRTPQELIAQGYVLGNCSHCHNPHGYPSVLNPVLVNVLDFVPGTGPNQGIFQFSLENYSPRITRGIGGTEQIPYITPSLVDLPDTPSEFWKQTASQGSSAGTLNAAYAPWRSLIYRNVDTPFTYAIDGALFPHMPMNTAGYDCRARQVLSDWMVSIPAARKNPAIPEYGVFTSQAAGVYDLDSTLQPYAEVPPGSPYYDQAVRDAQQRLAILHTGVNPNISPDVAPAQPYSRYNDCPDTSDILDPDVLRDPTCHPIPAPPSAQDPPHDGLPAVDLADLGVPTHADWINTDLTQAAGAWQPKRVDWANVLVGHDFSGITSPPACPGQAPFDVAGFENVVDLLQTATLSQVQDFATKNVTMGLWQPKAGCTYPSSQPTVSSFLSTASSAGAEHPQWMDDPASGAQANPQSAHVYEEWPGQAVFDMICINCHGPNADGKGRLADNLLLMTGGTAVVADFHDGLFGPASMPGQNILGPNGFASIPSTVDAGAYLADWTGVAPTDRAARYMAWMALGGTEVSIPPAILQIVANTQVLGVAPQINTSLVTANMLAVAQGICGAVLTSYNLNTNAINVPDWFKPDTSTGGIYNTNSKLLIASNGQAELFLRLCSLGNPPPVMTVGPQGATNLFADLYSPSDYGAFPVGNERGAPGPDDMNGIVPVDSTTARPNLRPWCARKSDFATAQTPIPSGWPPCPDSIDDGTSVLSTSLPDCAILTNTHCWTSDQINAWARRGAINAGFAVFLFLQAMENGTYVPTPAYDSCNLLPQ